MHCVLLTIQKSYQQCAYDSFWSFPIFIHLQRKPLCVICSVLEFLDSSCTLESNNWAEALNSGREEQHWSPSQDLLGPWWECTDSIWCCAYKQPHLWRCLSACSSQWKSCFLVQRRKTRTIGHPESLLWEGSHGPPSQSEYESPSQLKWGWWHLTEPPCSGWRRTQHKQITTHSRCTPSPCARTVWVR